MRFPFQTLFTVAHSLTFAFAQSTVPSPNNSAIALPFSFDGFTATTSDANNPLPYPGFQCGNGGAGSPALRPKVIECTRALFLLPQFADIKTFVRGGDRHDNYQLPKSLVSGSCRITIAMVNGVITEQTSWDHIGLDATRLVFACDWSTDVSSMRRTGGQVATGRSKGILIMVYDRDDTTTMMNGSSVM